MNQVVKSVATVCLALLMLSAFVTASAHAAFGFEDFDVTFANEDGSTATQAGSHPFAMTTTFYMEKKLDPILGEIPDGELRNLSNAQVPGLVGNPTAVPQCSITDFQRLVGPSGNPPGALPDCPNASVVGYARVLAEFRSVAPENADTRFHSPVYNLQPSPGEAAKLGFVVLTVPVTISVGVNEAPPYNVLAKVENNTQAILFYGSEVILWGNPADPAHDTLRGSCLEAEGASEAPISLGSCPAQTPEKPFLTLPRACTGPLGSAVAGESWGEPAAKASDGAQTHDELGEPQGMEGCENLGFDPSISSQPTSRSAESGTGLDFNLDVSDPGLSEADGQAKSDIKKAVVTLPEGMTINPSQAEGLGVCTEVQLALEKAGSGPGEGCPQASKIGSVEVETPLLEDEVLKGTLFVAAPFENRFGSLIALYMTIKSPQLGVAVSLAGKVELDPRSGRITAIFDDLPQLPFSHFRLRFRGGERSPLVTPPRCGQYATTAVFTPWADPSSTYSESDSFEVSAGVNGGPCPAAGPAPFHPALSAGTLDNHAGAFSPFGLRLSRRDGEQELTRLDALLPPGLTGKLAGIGLCPEAAIAAARAKSGKAELASPSCPASSQLGAVLAGAGVGPALTYVPGKIYLAGPFGGDPRSLVVITPAVAGPFDVGTVITRVGLNLDPASAEVQVDGAAADPIPHILAGVPLRLRDLRVSVDRPQLMLNATNCDPLSIRATPFGHLLDVLSPADDAPVSLAARYQAAGCAGLGFKPKLNLKLSGATKRSGHPALKATLSPRPGDANLAKAVVTLPHSAFLEQSHIRTICTRVQFAADACPPASIYGRARAITPLLDEPLEGPVYLRSSSNPLPDLVAALDGVFDVDLVGRIDSTKARIRTTFEATPDAPVSKFVLEMQGGKKGLIVNSRNLCAGVNRAKARLSGQNGSTYDFEPALKSPCSKQKANRSKGAHGTKRST